MKKTRLREAKESALGHHIVSERQSSNGNSGQSVRKLCAVPVHDSAPVAYAFTGEIGEPHINQSEDNYDGLWKQVRSSKKRGERLLGAKGGMTGLVSNTGRIWTDRNPEMEKLWQPDSDGVC